MLRFNSLFISGPRCVALLVLAASIPTAGTYAQSTTSTETSKNQQQEQATAESADLGQVVAGSPDDFMEVRHIRLSGSHRQIGYDLAAVAKNYGWQPNQTADPARSKAQLAYFEKYWPYQVQRIQGIAECSGQSLERTASNFSSLGYQEVQGGCSCFYIPPELSETGKGVFSRNFDFTTGPFNRQPRSATNPNACSRPFIVELHPDDGYATLAVVCFDLMGVVDGINSEGLTIALLADDEIMQNGSYHPSPGPRAGFGVVELPRYLLETCANVEEAKARLYEAKLYYGSIPCHYLIADAHGKSFIWENKAGMNDGVAIDGNGLQISTNFMHHLHPDLTRLPDETHPGGSFNRFRRLQERINRSDNYTESDIIEIASCVAATREAAGSFAGRTLWHALYDMENRSLKVSFYLGEQSSSEEASTRSDSSHIRRSPYLQFQLR